MKISELFSEVITYFGKIDEGKPTCDTYKSGNPNNVITGVGISMFATPEVIRECMSQGINFLIVHEPVFYNHWDEHITGELVKLKKKFIEDSGITIARYHDHAHITGNDLIYKGEMIFSRLCGEKIITNICAVNRFELGMALTANELAESLEKNLAIKHISIAGCTDKKGKKISCCFGASGNVTEELITNDFVLTGEICEWETAEIARDYAQFGYNKAILVMGHIGSERAGMMYLAEMIKEKHSELNVKYIECGEVYSYTD